MNPPANSQTTETESLSQPVHRAGFVTLLGRPNVGKSSLLNRLIDFRLSIVTEKPQTTRRIVKGIMNRPGYQVVFLDTPGVHEPQDALGEAIRRSTNQSLSDTDLIWYVTAPDVQEKDPLAPFKSIPGNTVPVFLVLNKADILHSEQPSRLRADSRFAAVYPVSALTGEGLDELLIGTLSCLPESPPYYDPDSITDSTEREIVAELIRESAWNHCYQEIPYGIEVRVEEFQEKSKKTYIQAVLYVERMAHKKMVIGKGGEVIKAIGKQARSGIEQMLGRTVYLDLWVKVEKNWRKRKDILLRWGYQTP